MTNKRKPSNMPKHKKQTVEVSIRRSIKHSFIADIQTNGRDEQGREVAPNGMKWRIAS